MTVMADVFEIAKARRTELVHEIAKLDEFIRMAETLVTNDHGSGPLSSAFTTAVQSSLPTGELPVVAAYADEGASSHAVEVKLDNRADAPGMPVAVRSDEHTSSYQEELVTSDADLAARSRETLKSPSRNRGYIDALRDRVQKYFRPSKTMPAITPLAYRCIVNYSVPSETVRAKKHHASSGAVSEPRVAAFKHPRERPAVAALSGDEAKSDRPKRGGIKHLVQSIDEIRERASQIALPVDVHLGRMIRQRRWMIGLTQRQLGERIGADIDVINAHESGARRIDATRLLEIASALQVPVAFFFEGLDSERLDASEARGEVLSAKETEAFIGSKSEDRVIASLPRSA